MIEGLFPKGSLVRSKSGGPTMVVFAVKDNRSEAHMPSALKKGLDEGDRRACYWNNKNDDPVLADFPVECLEEADNLNLDKL